MATIKFYAKRKVEYGDRGIYLNPETLVHEEIADIPKDLQIGDYLSYKVYNNYMIRSKTYEIDREQTIIEVEKFFSKRDYENVSQNLKIEKQIKEKLKEQRKEGFLKKHNLDGGKK
jgi:hypothetical protein